MERPTFQPLGVGALGDPHRVPKFSENIIKQNQLKNQSIFLKNSFRLTELRVLVTPGMSWDEFPNRV